MGKRGPKWTKYSPEFKRQAVDRMMAGESVTVLSTELGVRRKFFYGWRDAGLGSSGQGRKSPAPVTARDLQIEKLKKQVSELQRLAGQQAGELDFFAAALRAIEEPRPDNGDGSGNRSTPRSK